MILFKRIRFLTLSLCLLLTTSCGSPISELKDWLAIPPLERPPLESVSFSQESLTKEQAELALTLLVADQQARVLDQYQDQWDNRLLTFKEYQMPFYYQVFGEKPADGRSLFISLHGGGGAPSEVNDQQYENQQHLYDSAAMNSLEGVYLAPRAPTDTWNLWHQAHIDEFLNIMIQLAVLKEGVNPNKVYLLGYSAGGDGVYQLAPRMADRWAAASMMAGHPNDASPLSLRNTPFYIQMGALDAAYKRNEVAAEWGQQLDQLHQEDGEGYVYAINLFEGLGHWMEFKDAVALPWMHNFKRNPIPQKVVWKQDDRHHTRFYWLTTPEDQITTGGEIVATYDPELNEINISQSYSDHIQVLINDNMLNLDAPITVKYQDKVLYSGELHRSILTLYETLLSTGDPNLGFSCRVSLKNNQVITEENSK